MKRRRFLIGSTTTVLLLFIGSIIGLTTVSDDQTGKSISSFSLTSPNFNNGSYIPDKYTCMGLNINPELKISGVPTEAESLVLIMDDPDAVEVAGFTWIHWLLWNISPSITVIEENSVPNNTIQGFNSWNNAEYGGPCPPKDRDHQYFFKLYVLDIELNIASTDVGNLMEAMEGHIINQVVLIGRYSKSGPPPTTPTVTSTTALTTGSSNTTKKSLDENTPGFKMVIHLSYFTILSLIYKRKKRGY